MPAGRGRGLGNPFRAGYDPRRLNATSDKIREAKQQLIKVRALAAENAEAAIEALIGLMKQNVNQTVQYKAASELLVWAFGKPSTWTEIETGLPSDINRLPKYEQAELLRARLAQYSQAIAILENGPPDENPS